MSTARKRSVEDMEPTGQYKASVYGLQCGDPSFAEYYARNQPRRSRSAREFLDILDKLGLLNGRGRQFFGLPQEEISLNGEKDTFQEDDGDYDRLKYVEDRLHRSVFNGLKIWTLVTEIGKKEGVPDPRDQSWRKPVAAELNEYADLGTLVCVGDRFYLPNFAP
jgi:hypothetical protein